MVSPNLYYLRFSPVAVNDMADLNIPPGHRHSLVALVFPY